MIMNNLDQRQKKFLNQFSVISDFQRHQNLFLTIFGIIFSPFTPINPYAEIY